MKEKHFLKGCICFSISALISVSLFAAEAKRPESWLRKGALGPIPKRITDDFPLSDQSNQGRWEKYESFSDEFEGKELDSKKWYPKNPRWLGRQPAFFYEGNVNVSKGKLHLAMKKEELPEMPKDKGYHTYTSAAVQSKATVRYGYFEVKCRPMKSHGSSSFWFYDNTPDLWTEIDVFEIGGAAPGFEKKYNMNVHVFRTPTEKKHWSMHGEWTGPSNLADDYHVYGLEWDKEKLQWYFDGVLVRWVENTHWHQPLTLNFDSETMPQWFGLPKESDLPSTYSIEYVRAWKKGSRNGKANLDIYNVKPISSKMTLPQTFPVPGEISNEIFITAAPGEYEPASFVLRPREDIEGLNIKPSPLKHRDGGNIPVENIDIKVVKCWYQATTAWSGIHTRPKEGRKVLVPELLLYDDTLVRVDSAEQKNYVKLRSPQGDEYIWISNPNEPGGDKMKILSTEEYPIKDSPSLLPLSISRNTNKQLWITVKVPDNARAGIYTGTIDLVHEENVLASISMKLRILPFELVEPKTCYNLEQDFISSIYYRGKLNSRYPQGSISSEFKSKEQLRAELKDMFVHGITNPTCYQGFDKELLAEYLKIKNEAGMGAVPLYYLGVSANSSPESIKKVLDFVKPFGISEVYFYGIDEASGERLKAQRIAWQANREAGGKIFVAGGKNRNFEAMGDIQDLHICAGSPTKEEAAKWHSVGHKVFCYANPQGGPENPELWRSNFGLLLWKADYDGACTYCYQHSFGNVWNDFDHYHYRDHNVAYPTLNGVIDTIALEGYREAIDDVRYATTLKLQIERAKRSGIEWMKTEALSAEKWLSELDVNKDLDDIRSKMISYILKLTDGKS
jgi:beta-glucanase (GH16 family)